MATDTSDLLRGLVRKLSGNEDGAVKALVQIEPIVNRPVVRRSGDLGSVVGVRQGANVSGGAILKDRSLDTGRLQQLRAKKIVVRGRRPSVPREGIRAISAGRIRNELCLMQG